jgi:transcriptional regulator with XRE-family HTH domain
METSKKTDAALPQPIVAILKNLGRHIQIARKRRRLSEAKLAELAYTSRATIQRLEAGEPGVGIGILSSVLWVLKLHEDLTLVAAPERDEFGKLLETTRLPKRIHDAAGKDDKYDF